MDKKSNSEFGLSLQKRICDRFDLDVNDRANGQFEQVYNMDYLKRIDDICDVLFEKINSEPIKLLTYTNCIVDGRTTQSPHNFLLANGKTLSIRTTMTSEKVAPKVVGQPGIDTFNEYFSNYYGKKIENKNEVKECVYYHIHEMMPIFIDYFFQSDITVLITKMDKESIQIFKAEEIGNYSFSREEFAFSKNLEEWNESTTLKYQGKSIAEIQVHKDPSRFFKFRFNITNIPFWFNQINITNETLGISAEAAICDYFKLEKPESFKTRSSILLERQMEPSIKKAFENLPKAIKHSGSTPGSRGEQSKCSYDFVLEGNKTLSLKTNKGKMVCPPEVGQPGSKTCLLYFKDYFEEGTIEVTNDNFKTMVLNNIDKIMPIYLKHMFDSDWMLWIYQKNTYYDYMIIGKDDIKPFVWEKQRFSFSKATVVEWNESNSVRYDGKTIGEFQVHKNRNSFKFRFNLFNLIKLIEEDNQ